MHFIDESRYALTCVAAFSAQVTYTTDLSWSVLSECQTSVVSAVHAGARECTRFFDLTTVFKECDLPPSIPSLSFRSSVARRIFRRDRPVSSGGYWRLDYDFTRRGVQRGVQPRPATRDHSTYRTT